MCVVGWGGGGAAKGRKEVRSIEEECKKGRESRRERNEREKRKWEGRDKRDL